MFTFSDFEKAYYECNILKIKEIGCFLLLRKTDNYSKELYHKLNNINWNWNSNKQKLDKITKIIDAVKIWLMLN